MKYRTFLISVYNAANNPLVQNCAIPAKAGIQLIKNHPAKAGQYRDLAGITG